MGNSVSRGVSCFNVAASDPSSQGGKNSTRNGVTPTKKVVIGGSAFSAEGGSQENIPAHAGSSGPKALKLLHFNDVYNIEARKQEPCGGAARFVTKVQELGKKHNAMTLFSGDCLNPSLLSTITSGWQMAPVLNAMNIHTACLGNHDFDFGLENLERFIQSTNFPWLMANVLDKDTLKPLAGAEPSRLCEWQGIKVGLVGLVEKEWLETLSCIELDDVKYLDFVEEGRRLARELTAQGAQVVIALTHMRVPNDTRLAEEAPEIHLILGGHDHHYEAGPVGKHKTWVVKSGTDFRDLSLLSLELPGLGGGRPHVTCEHVEITTDIVEDKETAETVAEYIAKLGDAMDEVVGETAVPLDGRFKVIRTQESNLGNFVCDCWRLACGADLVILNSGTLRSDTVHPAGALTMRDLVSILPMLDETLVLEATGEVVLQALENGVCKWPALEGRFLQVSGVRFDFDPSKEPGQRVVRDSVYVSGKPLDMSRKYKLAVKAYMALGKDGFDCLAGLKELVRADEGTLLPTTIREHFKHLTNLVHPEYLDKVVKDGEIPEGIPKKPKELLDVYFKALSSPEATNTAMKRVSSSESFHASVIHFDHYKGLFSISPEVNQRIVCLAGNPP